MRFSGQKQQNFFSETLKANGRAGFSRSPVFELLPEPGKNQPAPACSSQLEKERQKKPQVKQVPMR
jgi:hypothetical protein